MTAFSTKVVLPDCLGPKTAAIRRSFYTAFKDVNAHRGIISKSPFQLKSKVLYILQFMYLVLYKLCISII